jgi:perosamine synthetase
MIPLMKPDIENGEIEAAVESLKHDKYVLGESVIKFEENFALYMGSKHAVSVNSGTSGLILSLSALGIKDGDQVLTTPMSFVATANSIIHFNAKPVFCDISMRNYNIDVEKTKTMTRGKKTAIPVHLYGNPVDITEMSEICREENVPIIEDACQAHGSEYGNKKIGTFGAAGVFSFYPSKNMTVCGDGGMVITDNDEIAAKVRKLRDYGRVSKYVHDELGYALRLNSVNAAIGLVQLRKLDKMNDARRNLAKLYTQKLADIEELIPPQETKNGKHVFHMFVVRTERRDDVIAAMKRCGIECGVHYPIPIHLQPLFKRLFGFADGMFPNAERLSRDCLSLPIFPSMTKDELNCVSENLHIFFGR